VLDEGEEREKVNEGEDSMGRRIPDYRIIFLVVGL
jgi:hypothetical protein